MTHNPFATDRRQWTITIREQLTCVREEAGWLPRPFVMANYRSAAAARYEQSQCERQPPSCAGPNMGETSAFFGHNPSMMTLLRQADRFTKTGGHRFNNVYKPLG